MTSHLQITFPTAISWFPEIFTSFHTTFCVHNNKWRHFRDSALELGSWPPFPWSPEHFTPLAASGHLQTMRLSFRPHLHTMARQYSHIVSIAPYLSRILMDEQVNAIWKLLEVCQLNANYVQTKFWNWKHTFCKAIGETKLSVLQNHWQKFTSSFSNVQVTDVEIHNAIFQLLMFDECSLVNPVAFVVVVRGRALNGQPLPILHVHQHLPLLVQAICAVRADIYARMVYLHARQG